MWGESEERGEWGEGVVVGEGVVMAVVGGVGAVVVEGVVGGVGGAAINI